MTGVLRVELPGVVGGPRRLELRDAQVLLLALASKG